MLFCAKLESKQDSLSERTARARKVERLSEVTSDDSLVMTSQYSAIIKNSLVYQVEISSIQFGHAQLTCDEYLKLELLNVAGQESRRKHDT